MAKAFLAQRARLDLIGIRRYTVDRWGKERARKYIGQIRHCANGLANHRLQGKPREDIAPDLKSHHVGRHVIFYIESTTGIEIARVLHDSMDLQGIFPEKQENTNDGNGSTRCYVVKSVFRFRSTKKKTAGSTAGKTDR